MSFLYKADRGGLLLKKSNEVWSWYHRHMNGKKAQQLSKRGENIWADTEKKHLGRYWKKNNRKYLSIISAAALLQAKASLQIH